MKMKNLFVIYRKENGGCVGYKPAKVNLPKGARICVDKEKMEFARVEKVVESTPEEMCKKWNDAKCQNRYFGTSANMLLLFVGMF